MASISGNPEGNRPAATSHSGRGVLNWGWFYDLIVWLFTRGREPALRQAMADLAQLRPGESVLDVGCGTGTLALVLKQRVGETGRVSGIDPGPRQIARARGKAARARVAIDFQVGRGERLSYSEGTFDAAVSTLVMHHLGDDLKRQALREIARVLKPGGRLLVVDFKREEDHPHQRSHRLRHHAPPMHRQAKGRLGMGDMGIHDQPALMQDAGFTDIESGNLPVQFPGQGGPSRVVAFTRARAPSRATVLQEGNGRVEQDGG